MEYVLLNILIFQFSGDAEKYLKQLKHLQITVNIRGLTPAAPAAKF